MRLRSNRKAFELWKCRVYGKRGKPKTGFPSFHEPLGNRAQWRRYSHISFGAIQKFPTPAFQN